MSNPKVPPIVEKLPFLEEVIIKPVKKLTEDGWGFMLFGSTQKGEPLHAGYVPNFVALMNTLKNQFKQIIKSKPNKKPKDK